MTKTFLFLLSLLMVFFLTSQASAIFGCAAPPRPDNYGSVWIENGVYHISICAFTPNEYVVQMLAEKGIVYDDGELIAAYNIRVVNGKPESYVGQSPLRDIINYLKNPPIEALPPGPHEAIKATITQARRIGGMLETFALLMEEDYSTHIVYATTPTTLSLDWNGIISRGSLEVPRYYNERDNIMRIGQILTEYYFNEEYYFNTQPEFQVSGLRLEFAGVNNRRLRWIQADSFLARYDTSENLQDIYTATAGTTATYNVQTRRLGSVSRGGTLYMNGQAVRNAELAFVEKETQICCATNPKYCIPAKSKRYALASLNTDCSFGVGEFSIEYDKETKETKVREGDTELVYNLDAIRIKELIS